MSEQPGRGAEERWRGRPVLSALLRAFIFTVPIAASVTATAALRRVLPNATDTPSRALRVAILLVVSTAVLVLADRLARRLMPLAVLLKLSMAFPNEAPSRMRLARAAASTRDLEARVEQARRTGFVDEPSRAAEHILTLVAAVEAHDRATRGHSERVRIYTDMLAAQMGLPLRDRDRLRWSALLHDVGKLEVPKRILTKPGKLTKREWEAIYLHPREGMRLTAPLREWLGEWACAIEQHHERFDGSGYPARLSAADISLGGRMVAITDSYETMTASRPYRRAMTAAKARAELVRCAGTHYDPLLVRYFLEISVKRLSLVSGPLSWVAQTPLLRSIEQAAVTAGRTATSGATAGAALLAISPVVAQPAAPAVADPRVPAVATPTPDASPRPTASPSPTASSSPKATDSPSPDPKRSPSPSPSPGKTLEPTPVPTNDPDDPSDPAPPRPTESPGVIDLPTDDRRFD